MRLACIFLINFMLGICTTINGQWSTESTGNTPVCTKPGDQLYPLVAYAGEGENVISWNDSTGVFAQKFDLSGSSTWGSNGVPVFSSGNSKRQYNNPGLIKSDNGSTIFSIWFREQTNISYPSEDYIMVQKLSNHGEKLFGNTGILIYGNYATASCFLKKLRMVPDNADGALIFYALNYIYGNLGHFRQYHVARINPSGTIEWSKIALELRNDRDPISGKEYSGEVTSITEDGFGGIIMAYWMSIDKLSSIHAIKFDSNGDKVGECVICEHDSSVSDPVIVKDGTGGGIVAWKDRRRVENNVELYAQRIDKSLVPQWTANGIPLVAFDANNTASGEIIAAPVNAGGAVFLWNDKGLGNYYYYSFLRAQRLTNSGGYSWGYKGKSWQISGDSGFPLDYLLNYCLVNDGNDNFILTENILQGQGPEIIRARKLKADGGSLWAGKLVSSNARSNQKDMATAPDGYGGAVIAWTDLRNGNKDIYAQQINAQGNLGVPDSPLNIESVQTLAIDPNNPNVVYAGTYNSENYLINAGNIYKSNDGGICWDKVLSNKRIESIAIDPNDSQIIYAGTFSDGIFKTTDGGKTWSQLLTQSIRSIAIDPMNSHIIYAGTASGAFFKSTDSGNSWVQKNNGLPASGNDFRPAPHSIAINPKNSSIIYVGTYLGIYKSTDGAESWTRLADYNVLPIIIDPHNPQVLYCGCDLRNNFCGMIKSTDAGNSWQPIGPPDYRIGDLAIDPDNSNNIYAASFSPGGVYCSHDAGIHWQHLGCDSLMIRSIAISCDSPHQHHILFAGAGNGGVFKIQLSRSNKTILVPENYATIQSAIEAAIDCDTILVAPGNYDISSSIWNDRVNNLILRGSRQHDGSNASIINAAVNPGTYVAIKFFGVSGCTIAGFEVKNAHSGISLENCKNCLITQNYIHDNDQATSWHGDGIEIFRSENISVTFNIIDHNEFHGIELQYGTKNINILNNTILQTYLFDGISMYDYLENITIKNNIIAYNREEGIELVYLAPNSPVNFVNDYNCFWQNGAGPIRSPFELGQNSIFADPQLMAISQHNYFLKPGSPCLGAGENGVNIGALGVSTTSVSVVETGLPTTFELGQNYPNPFNARTRIDYQIPRQSLVRITIFNVQGQEVKNLVNEEQAAGYHAISWDGQDNRGHRVGSGIYICQMKAENFVGTKKLAIVK